MTVSEKLRLVQGLHSHAEMFGFNWNDDSDWTWHDVACKIADEIDAENAELRELVRDYEELAAALCDARECDGCPFDSERTICEHMRLIARVGELGVDA